MSGREVLEGVLSVGLGLLAAAAMVGGIASVTTWAVLSVEDAVLTVRDAIERVKHEGQD